MIGKIKCISNYYNQQKINGLKSNKFEGCFSSKYKNEGESRVLSFTVTDFDSQW